MAKWLDEVVPVRQFDVLELWRQTDQEPVLTQLRRRKWTPAHPPQLFRIERKQTYLSQ